MEMTRRTALVDLDGTLTDPADGIIGGFQFALRSLGETVPERASLTWVIGPPLRQAFPRLLGNPSKDRVEAAVTAYRDYYRERGLYEATVYDGIPDTLERLRAAGFRLMVCTVKPRHFAGPVIEHFGLASHFDGIYGAELDGRFEDKGDLIEHIIAENGLSTAGMVMIGDRGIDMIAAKRNAIRGIGVTWGYGTADELREGGAHHVCEVPHEVPAAVAAVLEG